MGFGDFGSSGRMVNLARPAKGCCPQSLWVEPGRAGSSLNPSKPSVLAVLASPE